MFGIEKLELVEILYSDNNLNVGVKVTWKLRPYHFK
jgi:hypothetical protein